MRRLEIIDDSFEREVLNTLDVVKHEINRLLIEGLQKINEEDINSLNKLKNQMDSLNMRFVSKMITKFLQKSNEYKDESENELKQNNLIAAMMKLILATRIYENTINIELVKKRIKK